MMPVIKVFGSYRNVPNDWEWVRVGWNFLGEHAVKIKTPWWKPDITFDQLSPKEAYELRDSILDQLKKAGE